MATTKKLNLKKGDLAFVVGMRNHKEVVTIISVGAKFITTDCGGCKKFEPNGYGDYGYSLYESEAAYQETLKVAKLKKELIAKIEQGDYTSEFLSTVLSTINS